MVTRNMSGLIVGLITLIILVAIVLILVIIIKLLDNSEPKETEPSGQYQEIVNKDYFTEKKRIRLAQYIRTWATPKYKGIHAS